MPTFDEHVGRVAEKGWIVDRGQSYRSYGTDYITGHDSDYRDYKIDIGIDSQSGKVKEATILKNPGGAERCAKPWKAQSIPTPEEAAAVFELPERQSAEMRIAALEKRCECLELQMILLIVRLGGMNQFRLGDQWDVPRQTWIIRSNTW